MTVRHQRRRRSRLLLATVLAVSLGGPLERAAWAGDSAAEASEHFKRGVDFSKDGDFEAALVEFKRAYERSPNYRVLYNLGQTSRELRDYAGALRFLRRYLAEGGSDAPKRDKVEACIRELEGMVATLSIEVNVAGAEVAVDDVVVGAAPLSEPVMVSAGKRKVSARRAGYLPVQRYLEVAGTDTKKVVLELTSLKQPVAASPAPWIALAGTSAAAVVTGVLSGLAFSAKSDFQGALGAFPADRGDIDAKRSKMRALAISADVFGGLTAAGAAATIALFVVRPRAPAEPTIRAGFGSVQVTGTF